jgi:hypothetical protein
MCSMNYSVEHLLHHTEICEFLLPCIFVAEQSSLATFNT